MNMQPGGPQKIEDVLELGGRKGFDWTQTDVTAIWLPCLVALETEDFRDGTIGWLSDDTDGFWLQVLGGVALGLTARVAASPGPIRGKMMDRKVMQPIFRSFLTLDHVANELGHDLKKIVRIKSETPADPITLACATAHNDDDDADADDEAQMHDGQ